MTDYAAVLSYRYAGREWIMNGNNYADLVMLDGDTKPTKKSLDDAWPEVQQEIANVVQQAAAARASALAKLAALGLTDAEIAALVG